MCTRQDGCSCGARRTLSLTFAKSLEAVGQSVASEFRRRPLSKHRCKHCSCSWRRTFDRLPAPRLSSEIYPQLQSLSCYTPLKILLPSPLLFSSRWSSGTTGERRFSTTKAAGGGNTGGAGNTSGSTGEGGNTSNGRTSALVELLRLIWLSCVVF